MQFLIITAQTHILQLVKVQHIQLSILGTRNLFSINCYFISLFPEQGRELRISAGFRYQPPKEGSALFDVIEDVEESPISTPL